MVGGRKYHNWIEMAEKFELVDGVIFRRVYDAIEGEVQLRCCVSNVPTSQFELPGRGYRHLGYREKFLLDYHNGQLAGHQGRERTTECLERDCWWPGLREDVRRLV